MKNTQLIIRLFTFNVVFLLLIQTLYGQSEKTIKILAIGNSFSEDAIENYLHDLGKADGVKFVIGNMYIGGCSLEMHWKNASNDAATYSYRKISEQGSKSTTANVKLSTAIADEKWDYISFQQVSSSSGLYGTYSPFLNDLLNYTKTLTTNTFVKYALHMTWAYAQNSAHSGFANYSNNQITMYNAIIDATTQAIQTTNIDFIVPSGTAIQNGRTSYLGDSFCRDGYHLDLLIGRYTVACCWYEKLTGNVVVGNSFFPPGLSKNDAILVQNAAHYAIQQPYSVTDMINEIETPDVANYRLKAPVNIDFGLNTTASISPWNNMTSYGKGGSINYLLDMDKDITPLRVEITSEFGGINTNGPSNNDTLTINGWKLPKTSTQDSFFGNSGAMFENKINTKCVLLFSNFNPQQKYTFQIFSSRIATDNRESSFMVDGNEQHRFYVNSSSNANIVVKAENIAPKSDGTIQIIAEAGPNNNQYNKFFYLNAIQISPYDGETDIPIAFNSQKKIYLFTDSSNKLNINGLENNGSYSYQIITIDGKMIISGLLTDGEKIDITMCNKAYYILKIKSLKTLREYNLSFLQK